MNFRKAEKSEMSICAEVLKEAFSGYDFFTVCVDDLKRKKVFFNTMMDIWMRNGFKNGTVLVGEEDHNIVAVAVLQEPDDREVAFIDHSVKSMKMALAGGIKNTKAFLKMCEVSDAACHNLPDPKWHLVLLAVAGNCEGKGIGSSMLQNCVMPYIAQKGGGLFTLNTNTEINRLFYKKNGFVEFEESVLHANGKEIGNWSYKMRIEPV